MNTQITESTKDSIITRSVELNCFGVTEMALKPFIYDIAKPDEGLKIESSSNFPYTKLTLRSETRDIADATDILVPAVVAAQNFLKDSCFSYNDVSMEQAVADLFRDRGLTLSLAESCSGGLIAKMITDISGCSAYFSEGVVTYSNHAKMRLLGIPAELLEKYGAVSKQTAAEMSKGVRTKSGSDIGLAVTGIAGPDGGSIEKPVGTVFLSLASKEGCWTKRYQLAGNREEIRTLTATTGLDWLRRYLLKH